MRALICGISGQDGSYLAKLLLEKGYEVFGTSRDAHVNSFSNLEKLGIRDDVHFLSMAINDFRSVLQTVKQSAPDEVYNLAGQTSVGLSFEQPVETLESISIGTLNLLECIRFLNKDIKIYNACSSECFGDVGNIPANEDTPFRPRSPYAVAKATSFWEMVNYRDAYGLFACNGILYNHESPLRPERFVTMKIINSAIRISRGMQDKLELGNINIERDWGWAPEYVQAMWLMLQHKIADDYIIATGKTYSLKTFIQTTFEYFNMNWEDFVIINENFIRPSELLISKADPSKARQILNWEAQFELEDIIHKMISDSLQ